ncbi:MAG: 4Fe-4S binding protein [Candidatus Erginobacter occultus]|nr:4Fe-4S binding protein [Candidatus Erginobacter occultus]
MGRLRKIVQGLAAAAANSAFLLGQTRIDRIYQGPLKQFCTPGLNCYACPYAVNACPLGSLQYFIGYGKYHFSLYVAGFLLLFGALAGRLICGWICPFGLVQDLLYKIKSPKFRLPGPLRHLPWLALLGFVILVPLLAGSPGFCRFICPAGSLQGGVPFGIFSSQIRSLVGTLFFVKIAILVFFLAGSVFLFRLFCRTACPLGLIYGFFNRIALLGLTFDRSSCNECGLCEKACPVDLVPQRGGYLSGACIRCLNCRDVCPQGSFRFGLRIGKPATVQVEPPERGKEDSA